MSEAALFAQEYERILRTAFLLTGSMASAEDLAQDAFVRVHGRLGAIDKPGAYLQTTVANLCRSFLRRRTLEERFRSIERPVAVEPSGDELFDALATLPERQRAALVLRYYLDYADADIADALGVRQATVRSLVFRGLNELRRIVEP